MRHLLNLPLFIAFIATARAFIVAVVSAPPRGGDASLGAAYEIVFETFIIWLMLAIVLSACGAMGGFRWPRVRGFAGFIVGLMAFGAILLISLAALGIAIEFGSATKWGEGQMGLARLVAFGFPFLIEFYCAWIVNASPPSRDAPPIHAATLGLAALLGVVALVVSARESGRQGEQTQKRAAADNREENEKANEMRRQFAKLTDADSLFEWNAWLGDNVPSDVQAEARRRVAARPDLDKELGEAIVSGNTLWAKAAFSQILRLPFKPSPALVEPVRTHIVATAERLASESKTITYDGDKRLDYYEGYGLDDILKVSERLAETAGADLTDTFEPVAHAVALYPKSDTARGFPSKVAAAKKRISQILAAGHK